MLGLRPHLDTSGLYHARREVRDNVTLAWVALVVCAIVAGAAVVALMVARTSLEPLCAFMGIVGLGGSIYALARISTTYDSAEIALWAFAFVIAGAAGGYALASTLLHVLARRIRAETLPANLPQDPHKAAILVVSCSEPEFYDPRATAQMLQGLAEEGLLDASIGFLPFLFFAQKTRYRAVGGSNPAHRQLASIADKLGQSIQGATVRVALCAGPESLERSVSHAVRLGHRSVIVAELAVGESFALASAKEALRDLHLERSGVTISSTGCLTCSDRIIGMLAARVFHSTTEPESTGVVLVGHGQPEEIASKHPQMDEDEATFLSRLRMALLDGGLAAARIRIAWADWGEPDVTTSIRHLTALGCSRVIVQPSTFPLDTIATRLDLEIAVRQARVDESATIVTLSAWRDDPAVIAELRGQVIAALNGPAARA